MNPFTFPFAFTFPGGKKVIVKGAAIAGNVDTIKACPVGKRWKLLNIYINLTTDATVADRFPSVYKRDSAAATIFKSHSDVVTATLTRAKIWTTAVSAYNTDINGLGIQLLETNEDIRVTIDSGVVGDAYDYLIEYLEIDK
ncbi:hypothetical protein ES705_27036 [subsurface metagenome]